MLISSKQLLIAIVAVSVCLVGSFAYAQSGSNSGSISGSPRIRLLVTAAGRRGVGFSMPAAKGVPHAGKRRAAQSY